MTQAAAFAASLAVLEAAVAAQSSFRSDNKDTVATLTLNIKNAERAASWAAFDAVMAAPEGEREALGGEYGRAVAKAKGLPDASVNAYAMNGRSMAAFSAVVALRGADRVVTHGQRKGETVSGRDSVNALTAGKDAKVAAKANVDAAQKRKDEAPLRAKARALAAANEGMELADFVDVLTGDDKEAANAAALAVEGAMQTVRDQAAALANVPAMFAAIRDADISILAANGLGDFLADMTRQYQEHIASDAEPLRQAA